MTGILAFIAGIFPFLRGCLAFSYGAVAICDEVAGDNLVTLDNHYINESDSVDECRVLVNFYAGMLLFRGILWIVVSVLVLMFSCGDRYKNSQITHETSGTSNEVLLVNNKAEEYESNSVPMQCKSHISKPTFLNQEIQVDSSTLL
jgi:uncharacterized membrane protein